MFVVARSVLKSRSKGELLPKLGLELDKWFCATQKIDERQRYDETYYAENALALNDVGWSQVTTEATKHLWLVNNEHK